MRIPFVADVAGGFSVKLWLDDLLQVFRA